MRRSNLHHPQLREERIALIAYYKAQHRGFADNQQLDDWLEAEREVALQDQTGKGF